MLADFYQLLKDDFINVRHFHIEDWKLIFGFVGSFIIGVGLFNIVAAWIHQYLGHAVTAFCIVGGAGLTLLSMLLSYNWI